MDLRETKDTLVFIKKNQKETELKITNNNRYMLVHQGEIESYYVDFRVSFWKMNEKDTNILETEHFKVEKNKEDQYTITVCIDKNDFKSYDNPKSKCKYKEKTSGLDGKGMIIQLTEAC